MLECLVDGEICSLVGAGNRGLNYGDGLFETLVVENGRPRAWQAHMERLGEGCRRLDLEMPPQALLLREVQTVGAAAAKLVVKILLLRRDGARGYAPPAGGACTRIVSSHVYPQDAAAWAVNGVRAKICSLRLAIQPALGGIKHLNRLEQVLASAEIENLAVEEGVLLDPEDHVVSAIAANIFLVTDGRLLTPRLDRCGVRGVVRAQILSAFSDRCEQRRVHVEMLDDADEVFICNSVRGIVPVTMIDDHDYARGPVTRELQAWFADCTAQ